MGLNYFLPQHRPLNELQAKEVDARLKQFRGSRETIFYIHECIYTCIYVLNCHVSVIRCWMIVLYLCVKHCIKCGCSFYKHEWWMIRARQILSDLALSYAARLVICFPIPRESVISWMYALANWIKYSILWPTLSGVVVGGGGLAGE